MRDEGCASRRAAVGDAVGNTNRPEPAARYEQPRVCFQCRLDRGHARNLADMMLRSGVSPAMDARQDRRSLDPQHAADIRARDPNERIVCKIDGLAIVGAANECAKQHGPFRRTSTPFR